MNTVKIIYIGNEFYLASGTHMSSMYTENGDRYDIGFLIRDLEDDKTVTIRPATAQERAPYLDRLLQYMTNRENRVALDRTD